jgi:hypothetical protein
MIRARCASLVESYVGHCNNVRLNSAVGYVAAHDMLAASGGDPR